MLLPSKPLFLLHPLSPLQRYGISSLSPATSTLWSACPARVDIGLMFPPKHTIAIWGQLARSGWPPAQRVELSRIPANNRDWELKCDKACVGVWAALPADCVQHDEVDLEATSHMEEAERQQQAWPYAWSASLIGCTEGRETKLWSFVLFNYRIFCL